MSDSNGGPTEPGSFIHKLSGGDQSGIQSQFAVLLQLLTKISSVLSGAVVPSSLVQGTQTNDNAPTGFLGEYIHETVLFGAAVPLTSTTPADIASISLTPGDWDVWGNVFSTVAGSTTTQNFFGWISTVSATTPTIPNNGAFLLDERAALAGMANGGPVGMTRISIAAPTTVYLSMRLDFSVATAAGYGFIGARRAR